MKRLIKRPLKAVWRFTLPVRRPFVARFEAMIVRCCASTRQPHYCQVSVETGVVMDHLVREVVRLQSQVEQLQLAVDDLASAGDRPEVVGRISGGDSSRRSAAG